MSTLKTLSSFYFGHTVTIDNRALDFKEGVGPEIKADFNVGSYSLNEFVEELRRVLNTFGNQTYTVTVARATGFITITAPGAFTLLGATGTRFTTSIMGLMGFAASDLTGTTLTSTLRSGKIYRPQFLLRNFTHPKDYKLKESAAVNTSARGIVQTVHFGDGQRMKCNIIGATDRVGLKEPLFYENASGEDAVREFMDYLITKATIEFMPDWEDPDTYFKLILDSTRESRSGVEYELKNMRVPDFYETGDLVFRKVIDA